MSEPGGIESAKRGLRTKVRDALSAMTPIERAEQSRAACEHLASSDAFVRARTVMLFAPIAPEIDAWPLLTTAMRAGKRACLPRIDWDARTMRPAEVVLREDERRAALDAGSDGMRIGEVMERNLAMHRHGILEPASDAPRAPLEELDLVVVPGVAFDRDGGRLGRGGGFYDRFLDEVLAAWDAADAGADRLVCGIAFDPQIMGENERVPGAAHDVRVDALATPGGVLRFRIG
ncbi:MAG: 5-formyltetrahydrofolate cyclo-ligase [Phycisphaerales bacterium]|jgi:5-formyltetrahydrofolate cyclo-ligase|nr:5-formyltetrahydrofolate cyclo-ligase [Phycisphaerales bacterium]